MAEEHTVEEPKKVERKKVTVLRRPKNGPVVVSDGTHGWLVDPKYIPGAGKTVTLDKEILDNSPQAYNFAREINWPTQAELVQALWKEGIVSLDELSDYQQLQRIFIKILPDPRLIVNSVK